MGPTPDLTMLDLGLDVDAAKMRLEESKLRRVEARAEILGTAWQAEVDRERRRLAALRSRVGYEKSASVSYSSKTGGPAEMSATCARNCSSPTKPTWVPPMTVWSRAEPVCSLMWIN
jgi:hypothetical protein